MIQILFLTLVTLGAALRLRMEGTTKNEFKKDAAVQTHEVWPFDASGPRIDVYVMNLAHRKDRCQCMQQQLKDAPANFNIYRHEASQGAACNVENWVKGWRNTEGEQGIFCTNRKVWERASKGFFSSGAEYIVILEDDVKLLPKFWEQVTEMTKCGDWNYLNLDTWSFDEQLEDIDSANSMEGAETLCKKHEVRGHAGYGAHAQMIRQSFLPEMLKMATQHQQAMDVWNRNLTAHVKGYRWMPGIVQMFRFQDSSQEKLAACGAAGRHSDVGGAPSDLYRSEKTSSQARLWC